MDTSLVLVMFVGVSIAVMLWRSVFLSSWRFNVGWIVVSLLIGGAMLALWLIEPLHEWTGVIGFGLWMLLVIMPSWVMRLTSQNVMNGRYGAALTTARIAALLHPADHYPQQADLIRGYQLETMGDIDGAVRLLEPLLEHPTMRYLVANQYFRIQNRYADLLSWIKTKTAPDEYRKNPILLDAYLRALAATGDLNTLLAEFITHRGTLERGNNLLGTQILVVCAYTGREKAVCALLNGPFVGYHTSMKQVWLAITDFAAGDEEAGQAKIDALLALDSASTSSSGHGGLALQAARRIQHNRLVIAAEVLTPESAALADRIAVQALSAVSNMPRRSRPFITLLLIVANVLVFGLVMGRGGSDVIRALFSLESGVGAAQLVNLLYEMGALFPPAVLRRGEWWRVFNAIFLHIDITHLALNMLGLYVIGRGVEERLGWWRYLFVYFAAGIGSTLFVLWLTSIGTLRISIYLGASGAIMGMVGAMAAISLRDWLRVRSRAAMQGLRAALLILTLQTGFDLVIRETSLEGHLGGAVIGFIVALALLVVVPIRVSSRRATT